MVNWWMRIDCYRLNIPTIADYREGLHPPVGRIQAQVEVFEAIFLD